MSKGITLADLADYGESLDLSSLTEAAVTQLTEYKAQRAEAFAFAAAARASTSIREIERNIRSFRRGMRLADELGSVLIIVPSGDGPAKIIMPNPVTLNITVPPNLRPSLNTAPVTSEERA